MDFEKTPCFQCRMHDAWSDGAKYDDAILYKDALDIEPGKWPLLEFWDSLTKRQKDVVRALAFQRGSKSQIARMLGMSPRTLRSHIAQIRVIYQDHFPGPDPS